jgi:mono/diheme cytochrome c family protein
MKPILIIFYLIAALFGCSDVETTPPEQETPADTTADAGKEIYMLYCAQCHGPSGDGNGFIELDRPARSFASGGFSFGNTVHAISKTTSSGIPGTPMPPFTEILTPEQINLVAKHVRAFAPTMKDATPSETEMVVVDTALVVRGMIPPVQDGSKLHPRGIVIGNPDGFSYEYRADDVRLLSIRQGRFVSREDWGERGGAPLKLLGKITVLVQDGNPNSMFETTDGKPLRAQLLATTTVHAFGVVRYKLIDELGNSIATVSEYCAPTTGVRTLIEQHFAIEALAPFTIVPLKGTVLEGDKIISTGISNRTIIHATKGSE